MAFGVNGELSRAQLDDPMDVSLKLELNEWNGATEPRAATEAHSLVLERGVKKVLGADWGLGETGATGAQGIQGEKGDTGETGAAGANGADGANGEHGNDGNDGDNGDKGNKDNERETGKKRE